MVQIPTPREPQRNPLIVSLLSFFVLVVVFWSLQTVSAGISFPTAPINQDDSAGSQQSQGLAPQVAMTYTVTTAADNGDNLTPTPGSLRQAIVNANGNPGTDTINFAIAGAPPYTINLLAALPPITDAVIINGTSQLGFAGTPIIELVGSLAGAANGLVVNTSTVTIRGLVINRFSGHGIVLNGNGNLVEGNYIGTNVAGTAALGNLFDGVSITGSSNIVGGTAAAARNLISGNRSGVVVVSGTGNSILNNSIFSNTILGIDLGGNGVTANDGADGDVGPNNLQNYPVLTSANSASGSITIQGTLDSRPSMTYRVELFASNGCSPSGFGEAQTFIGATSVITDVSGIANINATFPVAVAAGQVITATATDPGNNTSEISRCLLVGGVGGGGGGGGNADLSVTLTMTPISVQVGTQVTKTILVSNLGPATATNVTLTDTLPTALSFGSCNATGGGVCGGSGNTRTVTFASLSPGFSAVVTIVGTVNCTVAGGIALGNTATVFSSSTPDTLPLNNLATATSLTTNPPPVIICPPSITRSNDAGQCGAIVTYPTIQVTDNCPGVSVFCSPPSGSSFPAGTTPVSCTAIDSGGATASCNFSVTITDVEPLTLNCPPNITVQASGGQCVPIVTYPAPQIIDNCPGATATCTPPSGTTFPVGTTLVTCRASDARGGSATCTFNVIVIGVVQVSLVLEGNAGFLDFGPISAAGKSRKLKKQPGRNMTMENTGCSAFTLSLESIRRLGADVDQGFITDADDQRLFSVYLIDPTGLQTKLEILKHVTVEPGQKVKFRVFFDPVIPSVVGRTSGLRAIDVVPDLINSRITFRLGNGTPLVINLVGHVTTEVQLTDPQSPRFGPLVLFERNGDEFITEYTIYDSNLDVNRATYQFFDGQGRPAQGELTVDLTPLIRENDFVKGQSFTVRQRFTGAKENKKIRGVRVAVFDSESASSANSPTDQTNISTGSLLGEPDTGRTIHLPVIHLDQLVDLLLGPGRNRKSNRSR